MQGVLHIKYIRQLSYKNPGGHQILDLFHKIEVWVGEWVTAKVLPKPTTYIQAQSNFHDSGSYEGQKNQWHFCHQTALTYAKLQGKFELERHIVRELFFE